MAFIRGQGNVPSSSIPAPTVSPLSPAQKLYASAKSAPVQPTLPAPSILTPPPSPHPGSITKYPAHPPQVSPSYQPAQNYHMLVHPTKTTGIPTLTTKAEAPKAYRPHESNTRANPVIHTTAAFPPPAPPHLHVSPSPPTVVNTSSPNYTLNTPMTAPVPIYQQLPPTPVSPPQSQVQFTNIHHMGQAVPPPGFPIQAATTIPAYQQ
ncbi:hypothetical protein C0992_000179, partial [Termitomyces sp. T32_za158]